MQKRSRKTMSIYEIPASGNGFTGPYELFWPLTDFSGSSPATTFTLAGNSSGFSVHFEASLSAMPVFSLRPPKGRVFEDDCLEIFVRPQLSRDSFFPAPFYYGWEISAAGILLDYRAGIGEEGRRIIGSGNGASVTDGSGAKPGIEPVHGVLREDILGTLISFDYDWKSKASIASKIDDAGKIWTLDISIPWSDFGLDDAPHGETWYFTANRIDAGAAMKTNAAGKSGNPGLGCIHEGIAEPRFHQPDLFPAIQIR
jgi:hypothetical protein